MHKDCAFVLALQVPCVQSNGNKASDPLQETKINEIVVAYIYAGLSFM
jgi:hypothetical protein